MAWKTSSAMDEKLRFVFEYERAPIISLDSTAITATTNVTFSITNDGTPSKTETFDIDANNKPVAGSVDIPVTAGEAAATVLNAILIAVNGVANFNVTASGYLNGNQVIVTVVNAGPGGVAVDNPFPIVGATGAPLNVFTSTPIGGDDPIYCSVTDSLATFGQEIVGNTTPLSAIDKYQPAVSPSYAAYTNPNPAGRLTLYGATNASNFSNMTGWSVRLDTVTAGPRIIFLRRRSAPTLAQEIAAAINAADFGNFDVTATASGSEVVLTNEGASPSLPAPFVVTGTGPGGSITGMADLNGVMYCVSDQGGLYILNGLDTGRMDSPVGDYGLRPFPNSAAEAKNSPCAHDRAHWGRAHSHLRGHVCGDQFRGPDRRPTRHFRGESCHGRGD